MLTVDRDVRHMLTTELYRHVYQALSFFSNYAVAIHQESGLKVIPNTCEASHLRLPLTRYGMEVTEWMCRHVYA